MLSFFAGFRPYACDRVNVVQVVRCGIDVRWSWVRPSLVVGRVCFC